MAWRARLFAVTPQIRFVLDDSLPSSAGLRNFLKKNIHEIQFFNPTIRLGVREFENVSSTVEIALHPFEKQDTVKDVSEIINEIDLVNPNMLTGKSLRNLVSGGPASKILLHVDNKSAEEIEQNLETIYREFVAVHGLFPPAQFVEHYTTSAFETNVEIPEWITKDMPDKKKMIEEWVSQQKDLKPM
eukprot:TRINITY_DN2422_c0_g1_i2.p1 TRINITY_DN2422_c0_g1~~TRINITY_DN2422_c0_g1_i2.p1  ORF type:complete len:211 (-),score=66.78 TRINITY_DN2422_c0_g1_i2:141-701(-)